MCRSPRTGQQDGAQLACDEQGFQLLHRRPQGPWGPFGAKSATQLRQGSAQHREAQGRGPWMKLGGTSRREFIPHPGNKHFLHHADPAVRHTHVYGLRRGGGGGPRERSGRQEGRTISVGSRLLVLTPRKLWENNKASHRRHHSKPALITRTRAPTVRFLPSHPTRPRTTPSPQ